MNGDAAHSLWTVALPVAVAALTLAPPAASAVSARRRARGVRRRLAASLGTGGAPVRSRRRRPRAGPWDRMRRPARYTALAAGSGALVLLAVGGVGGALAAACVAFGTGRWLRTRTTRAEQAAHRAREHEVAEQLPLTAELLAACLAAGSAPTAAARAVGECVGGPLGQQLSRTCAELRLGADPPTAWAGVARLPGAASLARCLERAHRSGAPAVAHVGRLAEECRASRARTAQARARRAGVLVTGPLALCFLPAFLLAGVAPVVVGLGRALL
ncbi:type II secretion system F family protein [Streptomyces sp. GSL17-111]|uniref:type II secretion system F family protein n=1 Tax=Streptomyces sp. GSL17-111 TaxID=3121596 RepID=UPI0030F3DEBD